jgi:hypothetical protein
MASFPSLSRYPNEGGVHETLAYDPSLKSQSEDGIILSRARFTTTKKKWDISYNYLTDTDKILLLALQTEVMVSADVFTWTNPQNNTSYTVRFAEPIKFDLMPNDRNCWSVSFSLIEV